MLKVRFWRVAALVGGVALFGAGVVWGSAGKPALRKAYIDGDNLGWRTLGEADFVNVNCDPGTWTWVGDEVHCTGEPVGVLRSVKTYTNFEIVAEWRHLRSAGNSGIFAWSPPESMNALKRNQLPQGIELQVLDHGYTTAYENETKKKADWFTTNGDVFPTSGSTMKPFPPVAPGAGNMRSFPRKNRSKGIGQWNHYYARLINGEVRLWVNGEEVSGGNECTPRTGYMALESEGSPVEFRNLRIRELP